MEHQKELALKPQMKSLVVISTTNMATDVRINRHLRSLQSEFEIITIGYGSRPNASTRHIEIPSGLPYLPISLTSLPFHVFRRFDRSAQATPAVKFVRAALAELKYDYALINDVQCLPMIPSIERPFIVDMHEYAPLEMEEDWRFRVLLMRYYTFLCKKYLPLASQVVTVSPGLATRYESEFNIDVDIIMNARSEVQNSSLQKQSNDQTIRLVHSGLAANARHLEWMIEAVGDVPGVSLDLYLVQAPRQARTLKSLIKLTAKYKNCSVKSPVPSSELPTVISNYDAGLLFIAPSSFSLRHCLPNKLFDCVQARRPAIVGPSPDMADFVRQHDVGFVCPTFDIDDLRKTLTGLTRADLEKKTEALNRIATSINEESEGQKLRGIVLSLLK
jgi:hypothetical protein